MSERKKELRPGLECWTEHINQYPLPDGLGPGDRVIVLANEGMHVAVQDSQGNPWDLVHWQLARYEFQGADGRWYDEATFQARDYLASSIHALSNERWDAAVEHHRQSSIARLKGVLRRHRRAVPDR